MDDWQTRSALVVGFGSIGRRHTRVLGEIGVADVRVCEPDENLRRQARDEYGIRSTFPTLDEGLADSPQTVFICSPTALHVPQAREAVAAGADVFVEKPLSVSLEGIDELAETADDERRVVMVGHCFRFHDGLVQAMRWLNEGRIGRLISVRCVMGEHIPDVMPNYRNMYISRYSGVYELMHDIDLALWYAGRRPSRAMAIDGSYSDAGMQSPDMVEMILEFPGRLLANVHLDFFERVRHRQTELLGSDGTIIIESARWNECGLSIYEASTGQWVHETLATDRDDMFRAQDSAFLKCTVTREAPPVDIAAGKLAVEVMLAAQESARTGAAVVLP